MAIHATDNLSHLAYQVREPEVPGHYDYDDYVIMEQQKNGSWQMVGREYTGRGSWGRARHSFLKFYNEDHRKVRLMGRVYN